jgi:tetratricopeptide (TPR) repeat protein
MTRWCTFAQLGHYPFDAATVRAQWAQLHRGDCEPLPTDAAVLQAWALFHSGEFQKAAQAGLAVGGPGVTVANKATCIHANYLEKKEKVRLELFHEVAERAAAQADADPANANAWYWQGYALGRYSQAISVAKALAQGLGGRVRDTLERAIRLQPQHADAHVALGAFHAEVIDKVGSLIGAMTYGAQKATGLQMFRRAIELNPDSAIARMEYANGLLMLEGEHMLAEATRLYEQAAASEAADAMERLHLELARAELVD